jgi:tRNA-specific 2-thiouridylase
VTDVNYVAGSPPPFPANATVKVRYTGAEVAATLVPVDGACAECSCTGGTTLRVTLEKPLRDITPGQGAVFYRDDIVLGGGIIAENTKETF